MSLQMSKEGLPLDDLKKAAEDFKSFTQDEMVFSLDKCKNY